MAMKIAVMNQKGGVGKSTVVVLMAAAIKKAGRKVAIDDRDVAQSSASWIAPKFGIPLLKDEPDAEIVLIDTPGFMKVGIPEVDEVLSERTNEMIREADKVILITKKAPLDVHATVPAAKLIKSQMRDDAKAFVLFNHLDTTDMSKTSGDELATALGMTPLQQELPQASCYKRAMDVESGGFGKVTGRYRNILLLLAVEVLTS